MKFVTVLLSNSAFTITPSCVSTFSTSIFNHISFIILNVLFISFFTILPRDLLCILSCCTFTFVSYTTMSQPTTVFFSLFCILGTGFLFSLLLIFLLLSCFFFHTSYIVLLSFLYLHLPLFFSITILQDNRYTTHFLTILQR